MLAKSGSMSLCDCSLAERGACGNAVGEAGALYAIENFGVEELRRKRVRRVEGEGVEGASASVRRRLEGGVAASWW